VECHIICMYNIDGGVDGMLFDVLFDSFVDTLIVTLGLCSRTIGGSID
jgi:hypothetical protein